jgi:hypothetical protein
VEVTLTDIFQRLIYGTQLRNYDALVELCKEAADEIDRLRSTTEISPVHVRELQADNARLNAVINGLIEKGMDDLTMVAAFQVNEELHAEIERLRAVLLGVQESTDLDEAHGIARRALENKP